jgi:excisionase family DNA binding protein
MRGGFFTGSDLITLDEAAARLGVARNIVRRRIREAGIRPPKPGRHVMLTEADYQQLVESTRARTLEPPAPAPGRDAADALRRIRRLQTARLANRVARGPVVAFAKKPR